MARQCPHCPEFVQSQWDVCPSCGKNIFEDE